MQEADGVVRDPGGWIRRHPESDVAVDGLQSRLAWLHWAGDTHLGRRRPFSEHPYLALVPSPVDPELVKGLYDELNGSLDNPVPPGGEEK